MAEKSETLNASIEPLTPERWSDFERLFGIKGAFAGCWCMYWRLKNSDFYHIQGEGAHTAMRELVFSGKVPGLLAYANGEPVGWCSVGPREDFTALERSRTLKRVDDQPVWSIVCFFIAKAYRRHGLMAPLIQGAIQFAVAHGAKIVEAYPIDTHIPRLQEHRLTGFNGYTGIASVFHKLGFIEIARASDVQVILRYTLPA